MNQRKQAFQKGLSTILTKPLSSRRAKICTLSPKRYNPSGMPYENQIIAGNSIDLLNAESPGWVDLIFADPPFNIGYLYHGYDDEKKADDYLDFSKAWMTAVHRALKPTGSFYLAIGDDYAAELTVIAKKIGFTMRNWIIWHYTFGQQTKAKFARSHTHILYFTKDPKNFTFNADSVRVASARQTTYGDSRANPKGKLPDDTWYLRPQEAVESGHFATALDTWNVSRLCGTFKEREGWHGCQMPIAVLDRIIKASSNPGDTVLDPFNGSGTTCVSAVLLDRKYVGFDQSEQYVQYARKRLEHALEASAKSTPQSAVADPRRSSKVLTATDAFGRARVPRRRAAKSA
jgi:site-specific DNA-methyltransferase (adenine-specific)